MAVDTLAAQKQVKNLKKNKKINKKIKEYDSGINGTMK